MVAGQDGWAALKTKLAVFQSNEPSGYFLVTRYSAYIPESNFSFFFLFFCTLKVNGMWRHGVWVSAHMQYLRRNAIEVHKSRAIQFRAAARRIFGVAYRFLENSCIPVPMDEFFKFHFISRQ